MNSWYRDYKNLIESNEKLIVYHGTHTVFDGEPIISDIMGLYGKGVYFSTNIKVAKQHGPIIVTCEVHGRLASNAQLDAAIEQAKEEGFVRSSAKNRATEILIDSGYIGVKDIDLVVVYVQNAIKRINTI